MPTLINRLYAHLERSHLWALIAFSVIYLTAVMDVVRVRRLWEDELFTYALARLSPGELWRALLTGGDQHPYPFYRVAGAFLGITKPEVALRVPAVAAGLLLALALYAYVAPRTTPIYGLLAMLMVMTTRAWSYAFEARGYEALAAGLAVAFVGWANAHRRWWGLVVMASGLLLAAFNHYYALLGLVPLLLGESARSWERRHIDWRVWAAFAVAGLPALVSLPLLRASRPYGPAFWGQPSLLAIPATYNFLLGPAVCPLLFLLIAATLSALRRDPSSTHVVLPRGEAVTLLGFVALPVVTITGSLITRAFTPRYAIATVIGVTVLATLGLHRAFVGRVRPGLAAVILLAGWCEWQSLRDASEAHAAAESQEATAVWMEGMATDGLPLVAWQAGTFLELAYYGPPDLTRRLVFVADAALARRYLGTDTAGRSLLALRPWFPPTILSYEECVRAGRFLLFGDGADDVWRNWLLSRAMDDGARLTLVGRHGDRLVFLVDMGPDKTSPGVRAGTNPAR